MFLVTNTFTVNGTLSATGQATNGAVIGSGAGGSINISAGALTGTGTIQANGGSAAGGYAAGGSGGRIGLNGVTLDTFSGTLQVNGAVGGNSDDDGKAGTIYFDAGRRNNLTLGGGGNLSVLRLGSDGADNYTFGSLTIQNGGILEIDGNYNVNSFNGGAATLNLATSLNVQAGGILRADGLGFSQSGTNNIYGPGGNANTSASYGGMGGDNGLPSTYGSLTNPLYLGSAVLGSDGGGVILITTTGTVTLNGLVSAVGANDTTGVHTQPSGGSINITAATLTGGGTVQADGGSGAVHHQWRRQAVAA